MPNFGNDAIIINAKIKQRHPLFLLFFNPCMGIIHKFQLNLGGPPIIKKYNIETHSSPNW